MATHYKGERITELLNLIAEMEKKLNDEVGINYLTGEEFNHQAIKELALGYTSLALAKAKLTALQGEDK